MLSSEEGASVKVVSGSELVQLIRHLEIAPHPGATCQSLSQRHTEEI
jgi:hypothetical protein